MEKRVVDYLLEGKKRGFSVQLLSHKLVENGWDEATVREAVDFIEKQSAQPSNNKQIPSVDLRINSQVGQKTNELNKSSESFVNKTIIERPAEQMQTTQTMPQKIHTELERKPGVFRKIGMSLGKPNELFDKTQEDGVWQGIKYLWTISLVPFILLLGAVMFMFSFVMSYISALATETFLLLGTPINEVTTLTFGVLGVFAAAIVIMLFAIVPLLTLVLAAIMHLFTKLFKGQGSYAKTFNAIVYGLTPQVLFFFIPIIGIWSLVLEIIGIAKYHKMSKLKAFFVLFTTFVFYVVVAAAMLLILGMSLPGAG